MRQGLFPLRVDASSANGAVRLIDTLLLDPTCLPHPLTPPYRDAIEANVRTLADGLLSDMEVHCMVRSSRHFSGRTELVRLPGLRERVEDQVRAGLWHLVDGDGVRYGGGGTKRTKQDGEGASSGGGGPDVKKLKSEETAAGGGGPASASGKEDRGTASTSEEKAASAPPPTEADAGGGPTPSNLIRVHVRLRENNVTVLDEFDVDPTLPAHLPGGDPISVAESLAEDLKLPPEMAVSVATTIVEQMHGLEVEGDVDRMDPAGRARRDRPAAWAVDAMEVAAGQVTVVNQCRPTAVSPAGSAQRKR